MKTIKIEKLVIERFKGIRELTVEFSPSGASIYGDNATGKTTVYDAYLWLLFGKDSQGKADFEIKPLDKNGEPIHGIETKVEGVFSIDGKFLTLRKVFKEKWVKKRGQAKPVFTGHTTDYFVNGLPVSKRQYEETVAEILPEKTFHLLSDVRFFNEKIGWEERRKILLEVCGSVTDVDVASSNPKFSPLLGFLEKQTPEERKKALQLDARKINKELEQIPVRISEQERILSGIENLPDEKYLKGMLEEKKALLKEKREELLRAENNAQVIDLQRKKAELERQIAQLETEHRKAMEEVERRREREIFQAEKRVGDLKAEIKRLDDEIRFKKETIEELEEKLNELRKAWEEENKREFTFVPEQVCPTCGQLLPEEKIEEARNKALEDFNREKARKLASITQEGKATRERYERTKKALESLKQKREEMIKQKEQAEADLKKLEGEQPIYPEPPKELKHLKAETENLDSLIGQQREKISTEPIREEIRRLEAEVEEIEKKLAAHNLIKQAQARIEELRKEERYLAEQYESIQQEIYLLEEFTRYKVNFLEEKINKSFSLARFKLFEEQINGGLKETCEVTYEGVPYRNLNHGMRVNVGLDIINTLSRHLGVCVPTWVDNGESVTSLINNNNQLIRLVVSESDKTLRIENE